MQKLLKKLQLPQIDEANKQAVERMIKAEPVLIDFRPARDVIPDMGENMVLHAGPPVDWAERSAPQKGAVIGAALVEGWASTPEEAEQMAETGEFELVPCHHHSTAGSMAGIISPSIPVWVVKNQTYGTYGYSGLESDLSFGGFSEAIIKQTHWEIEVLQPILSKALSSSDGIALNPVIAKGLHMGDDCHMRFEACTYIITNALFEMMLKIKMSPDEIMKVFPFLDNDRMFGLGICMAAGKSVADAAKNIPYSSMITTIARNGTECGIRVSALGDEWFTGPAYHMRDNSIFFTGFSGDDASPDMGDSAITETIGLGAASMMTVPTHWPIFGPQPYEKALKMQQEMWDVTLAKHPLFTMPQVDFQGTALGYDIRKVVETGFEPLVSTAIASKHRKNLGTMVGAGVSRVPMQAFEKALQAFAAKLGV
jgi:hypothetical protein